MSFWEIKQKAQDKLELYIYSEVEKTTYDYNIGKTVESEASASHFSKELEKAGNIKNIDIHINSYGGSVPEGIAIYNQLKRHNAYKTVYIDGFACSIAAVIAMVGDKVVMPANAILMLHNAWTFACGNAKELRKTADDIEKISNSSKEAFLLKSNGKITEEKLDELLDVETYLSAEECLYYGFIDEIENVRVDLEYAKQMLQEAKQSGLKRMEQKLNNIVAKAQLIPLLPSEAEQQTSTKLPEEKVSGAETSETKLPEEKTSEAKLSRKEQQTSETQKDGKEKMLRMFEAMLKAFT